MSLPVSELAVVVGYDVVELRDFDGRVVVEVELDSFSRQLVVEVVLVLDDPDLDLIAVLVPDPGTSFGQAWRRRHLRR